MIARIRFDEVLRPFRNLEHLSAFAFPRNTNFLHVLDVEKIQWPPNLQEITLSGTFCFRQPLVWGHLVRCWPVSIHHMVWDHCVGLNGLCDDPDGVTSMPRHLHSVHVTNDNTYLYPQNLAVKFSGVVCLSLPANLAVINYSLYPMSPVLERLEIRGTDSNLAHRFARSDLLEHVIGIPTLRQIRLQGSLVEEHDIGLEVADALLRSRAPIDRHEDVGSTIKAGDFGVTLFND